MRFSKNREIQDIVNMYLVNKLIHQSPYTPHNIKKLTQCFEVAFYKLGKKERTIFENIYLSNIIIPETMSAIDKANLILIKDAEKKFLRNYYEII